MNRPFDSLQYRSKSVQILLAYFTKCFLFSFFLIIYSRLCLGRWKVCCSILGNNVRFTCSTGKVSFFIFIHADHDPDMRNCFLYSNEKRAFKSFHSFCCWLQDWVSVFAFFILLFHSRLLTPRRKNIQTG